MRRNRARSAGTASSRTSRPSERNPTRFAREARAGSETVAKTVAADPPGDLAPLPAGIETENHDAPFLRAQVAPETSPNRRLSGPRSSDEDVARAGCDLERHVEAGRHLPRARRDAVEEN